MFVTSEPQINPKIAFPLKYSMLSTHRAVDEKYAWALSMYQNHAAASRAEHGGNSSNKNDKNTRWMFGRRPHSAQASASGMVS